MALLVGIHTCLAAAAQESTTPAQADLPADALAPAEDDALARMNDVARELYADGGRALREAAGPVILVAFDDVILHHLGERRQVTFTPELYHRLKQVSHLPLGILGAALSAEASGSEDDRWRDRLARLDEAAAAVRDDLDRLVLPERTRQRQHRILDVSQSIMATLLGAEGTPGIADLGDFAATVTPWTLANATEAAFAQLDGLHQAVGAFRTVIGSDWQRVRVVVLGPRAPRIDNLAMNYFRTLLGPDAARERLTYAENIWTEEDALELLEKSLIDRRLGRLMFDEAERLERDLLGDAAKVWTLTNFGKLGAD